MIFQNRSDAGQKLASQLLQYKNTQALVVALPRGGVPVGYEVAKLLNIPLEIVTIRKIGSPHNKEFGIGALASSKFVFLQDEVMQHYGITKDAVRPIIISEIAELLRRKKLYGEKKKLPKDMTFIVVDDGLATGITAKVAVLYLKRFLPKKIVLAVPVCPPALKDVFEQITDKIICIEESDEFSAVGESYRDFSQVTDEEVIKLLREGRKFGR